MNCSANSKTGQMKSPVLKRSYWIFKQVQPQNCVSVLQAIIN